MWTSSPIRMTNFSVSKNVRYGTHWINGSMSGANISHKKNVRLLTKWLSKTDAQICPINHSEFTEPRQKMGPNYSCCIDSTLLCHVVAPSVSLWDHLQPVSVQYLQGFFSKIVSHLYNTLVITASRNLLQNCTLATHWLQHFLRVLYLEQVSTINQFSTLCLTLTENILHLLHAAYGTCLFFRFVNL